MPTSFSLEQVTVPLMWATPCLSTVPLLLIVTLISGGGTASSMWSFNVPAVAAVVPSPKTSRKYWSPPTSCSTICPGPQVMSESAETVAGNNIIPAP
jgi:hypothetical protein